MGCIANGASEQKLRVQTFLFRDGVAYNQDQKFLNTTNPTLFQQLKSLTHPETAVGVPDGTVLNRILRVRERLYAFCNVFEAGAGITGAS